MKKAILFSILGIMTTSITVAQTRIVLIEQFTNSGCPPCASSSPSVFNFVDSNPSDVVAVAYHTSFPYNDSMYFENPTESNARVALYGISGVPYSVVDGNYYLNGSPAFVPIMSSTITTRKAVSPKYDIESLTLNLTGNLLTGSFRFISLDGSNSTDNLVAHIVVIEKNVLKSSYAASPGANSETEYGYVMRKMFPNSAGTILINKALGNSDTIALNWTLNKIKDINELKVVAFIQNTTTKEVYQAKLFTPSITPVGINDITFSSIQSAILYPNPTSEDLSIEFNSEQFVDKIEIINQLGELVYVQEINSHVKKIDTKLSLVSGIYYVKVLGNSINKTKKISIVK